MRFLLSAALALCLLPALPTRASDLPAEITGVWATAESEFNGDRLLGGEVLYVAPSGMIALVGAPLPVRRGADGRVYAPIIGIAGTASYDAARHQLSITLRDGQRSMQGSGAYRPDDQLLELSAGPDGQIHRLVRRQAVLPESMQKMLSDAARANAAQPADKQN